MHTLLQGQRSVKCANCTVFLTTNDNTHALRFYQKWGLRLARLYPNLLEEWRRAKPEMGTVGFDGIPLRDAFELEMML